MMFPLCRTSVLKAGAVAEVEARGACNDMDSTPIVERASSDPELECNFYKLLDIRDAHSNIGNARAKATSGNRNQNTAIEDSKDE
jgi:hypothetical protein